MQRQRRLVTPISAAKDADMQGVQVTLHELSTVYEFRGKKSRKQGGGKQKAVDRAKQVHAWYVVYICNGMIVIMKIGRSPLL